MASISIGKTVEIDYNMSGEIRSFELFGCTVYDRDNKVETVGWQRALKNVISKYELDAPDERGLHAFVLHPENWKK